MITCLQAKRHTAKKTQEWVTEFLCSAWYCNLQLLLLYSAETSASMDAVASGDGSTPTEAAQSQETVEDEEAAESGSDSHVEDVEPSRSQVLQFLKEEAAKEEEHFNWHHQALQQNTTRFEDLFEELVTKNCSVFGSVLLFFLKAWWLVLVYLHLLLLIKIKHAAFWIQFQTKKKKTCLRLKR